MLVFQFLSAFFSVRKHSLPRCCSPSGSCSLCSLTFLSRSLTLTFYCLYCLSVYACMCVSSRVGSRVVYPSDFFFPLRSARTQFFFFSFLFFKNLAAAFSLPRPLSLPHATFPLPPSPCHLPPATFPSYLLSISLPLLPRPNPPLFFLPPCSHPPPLSSL